MDFPTIIMWVLIGGGAVSVLYFGLGFLRGGERAKRINSVINKQRGELSRQQLDSLSKPSSARQLKSKEKNLNEVLNRIYKSMNLEAVLSTKETRNNLMQAGYRGKSALAVYYASRVLGAIAGFILTYLFIIYIWKTFPYPDMMKLVFAAVGGAAGFYLPKLLVTNTSTKRQQEMNKVFPDTLDLMVICVEAGLSVEAAFVRVTEEIMETSPVLAQELGLTSAELAYLGDRRKAFKNLADRTGLPAINGLCTTLIQSEQYGTPVGSALNVLAKEKRAERMAAAEKKAAALPAKLTVPMILFFLPVLFVVVIGPAAMSVSGL